jgi:hypothetical protein
MDKHESDISESLQMLSEQLWKLVKNAEIVRTEPFQRFKDELSRELLWLRPSVSGISAISCHGETPQLGFKISIRDLERKIKEKRLSKPARPTPEKQLQSWLIQKALKSGGRLRLLDEILGGQYWFVSDELAIKTSSKKMVADLLLVKVDAEGLACLVNAELKSGRVMETFKQVICFRAALEHPDLQVIWRRFAEIMTGETFQWQQSQETRGVVVWPARNNPISALANKKRKDYERVDLIGYQEIKGINEYTLECEKVAERT